MEKLDLTFICQSFSHSTNHPFGQGGTDSQIYGLADALGRMGHDVNILGNFLDDNWNEKDVKDDNFIFHNINSIYLRDKSIGTPLSLLLLSKKYASYLKTFNTDVVLLMAKDSAYYPSKLNIPKIYVTHNPDGMYFYKNFLLYNNKLNSVYFYYRNWIEENVMRNSDLIVALNSFVKEYLITRKFNKIINIPNAVNPSKYQNKPEKPFILFAGGLRKVKDVEILIRSFECLKDNIDLDLLIIGSGPDEKRLKNLKLTKELGERIKFIPLVSKKDLIQYLAMCSIFVLPSRFEMMPVTLLEAMASEKPVIGSNIPGINDVINDGHNGLLFPKKSLNGLNLCMELLCNDRSMRKKLGKNARKTIEEKYSFNKIAQEYTHLASKLI